MPMLPALSQHLDKDELESAAVVVSQSSAGCSSRGPRLSSSSSSSGCELEGVPQIPEINIENFFERLGDVGLPEEVYALFDGVLLPQIAQAQRLKWSCNETWLLELDGDLPLCPDSTARSRDARRAVVQIAGAQLHDKPIFRIDPTTSTAQVICLSIELARAAGVPVPDIHGTGTISSRGTFKCELPFVVFGFVPSSTVDDDLLIGAEQYCNGTTEGSHAPGEQAREIYEQQVFAPLKDAPPQSAADTAPVCRFESTQQFVKYLRQCSHGEHVVGEDVIAALDQIEMCHQSELADDSETAILVHQDGHELNILCSRQAGTDGRTWALDAVIDWESSAIVDHRLAYSNDAPWSALRDCGQVVKGRWLAAAVVQAMANGDWSSIPRCDLNTLSGEHDRSSKRLVRKGLLRTHVPWFQVFETCALK